MSKKLLSLAIGLITLVALVPQSQATSLDLNPTAVQSPSPAGRGQIALYYKRKVCRVVMRRNTRTRVCRIVTR